MDNKDDNNVITFGKHKNRTWIEVFKKEQKYCRWVENTMPKFYDFWLFQKYVIIRNCMKKTCQETKTTQQTPSRRREQNSHQQSFNQRFNVHNVSDDNDDEEADIDIGAGKDGQYDCSRRCYKCNRVGHYARNCNVTTTGSFYYG